MHVNRLHHHVSHQAMVIVQVALLQPKRATSDVTVSQHSYLRVHAQPKRFPAAYSAGLEGQPSMLGQPPLPLISCEHQACQHAHTVRLSASNGLCRAVSSMLGSTMSLSASRLGYRSCPASATSWSPAWLALLRSAHAGSASTAAYSPALKVIDKFGGDDILTGL